MAAASNLSVQKISRTLTPARTWQYRREWPMNQGNYEGERWCVSHRGALSPPRQVPVHWPRCESSYLCANRRLQSIRIVLCWVTVTSFAKAFRGALSRPRHLSPKCPFQALLYAPVRSGRPRSFNPARDHHDGRDEPRANFSSSRICNDTSCHHSSGFLAASYVCWNRSSVLRRINRRSLSQTGR